MEKITLEKLNFFELKEILKKYCVSSLGKKLIDDMNITDNIKVIQKRLDETSEARNLLDASYYIPLEGISNVTPLIEKIDKGASLEASELISMSDFLRGSRKIKDYISSKRSYAGNLYLYGQSISDLSYIEEEINMSIKGDRVDSNASKELKKIRKQIDICEVKIKEKLEKFLRNPQYKEYIGEFFVSTRNGRYTIPIKSSYKKYVDGEIIESSSKGTTVFIEPSSVSKYTSELNVLKAEESVEEYKILSNLTEMIYQKEKEIKMSIDVISEFDMICAKGKFSRSIDGIRPLINEHGYIKIINGCHPLIKNFVPLNFEIGKDFRTLIITGPNAGGKTVVLKTVGLLTLQTMMGLHIKADEGTEISLFKDIFVDIGDNQSIENSLSTFSSHVKNLAYIIKKCSRSSLLLFDEIGSGTEPNEGAALAISVLEKVYKEGAITVSTTHYGEIKNFSKCHDDFENAAMEFEKDTLEPLYKLSIGKSGDSNAFYISRKMGIPEEIVKKAEMYVKNKNYSYDSVNDNKVRKEKNKSSEEAERVEYYTGDKVILLDKNEEAIVYEGINKDNNVTVFYKNEYIEVNYKRVKLKIRASSLYPEDYDMNQLFVSFKERKLQHDIERGSKKALKAIRKSIKNR